MADRSFIVSVSQLNFYLKSLFDGDNNLSDIFVSGEISNLKRQYSSGHIYFTLKDDCSAIPAIIFKSYVSNINFELTEGTRVICHAKVSVYDRDTKVQLYVNHIQPFGIGSLYLAFEQLKTKLQKKGLFDDNVKKTLPLYPKRVAVLTSESGSVFYDITTVTSRRYPLCELCLIPVPVQGEGAEYIICEALKKSDKSKQFDVIIIARGGGSFEDLQPFNTQVLAETIYDCSTPVVSAIGHETDFTICDFVSDLRAPTPSAAAELVFKDIKEILYTIKQCEDKIKYSFSQILLNKKLHLQVLKQNKLLSDPENLILTKQQFLQTLKDRLYKSFSTKVDSYKTRFATSIVRLGDLNPLTVLSRGYSIASIDGKNVNSVNILSENDLIDLKLCDGIAHCKVLSTEKNNEKK